MSPRLQRVRAPRPGPRAPVAARLPAIHGGPAPAAAAARLAGVSVALAGAGSVGFGVVDPLARMGLRSLLVADPSVFKNESLLTHPVIGPAAIDRSKALTAARHAARLDPALAVYAWPGRLEELPLDAWVRAGVDVLFVATDNLAAEVALGAVARTLGIPLIRAAVEGRMLTAQVAVYANADASGPCPGCFFGRADWAALERGQRFSCSGERVATAPGEPTRSLQSLCGLAADLAVQQFLRLVLEVGAPVADTLLTYSGHTHDLDVVALPRSASCPCDHRAGRPVRIAGPLDRLSVAALLQAAVAASGGGAATVQLEGYALAQRVSCACGCDLSGRFVRTAAARLSCPRCRTVVPVGPFQLLRAFQPRHLGAGRLQIPVRRLGAAGVRSAQVRGAEHVTVVWGGSSL